MNAPPAKGVDWAEMQTRYFESTLGAVYVHNAALGCILGDYGRQEDLESAVRTAISEVECLCLLTIQMSMQALECLWGQWGD